MLRHAAIVVVALGGLVTPDPSPADAPDEAFYETRLAPILEAECYGCHSARAAKLRGGLRLDDRRAMLDGGDSGPAVVPGKSGESLLIQAMRHQDGLAMPPKKPPLSEETIAAFVRWIDQGAPMPASAGPGTGVSSREAARRHWAFQPIRKPEPPFVRHGDAVRNPIDAFILAKLEAAGIEPAPPAEPRILIRRLTFDLTGLPPTPEEVDEFVRASKRDPQGALEAAVDRLLASPRHGEHEAQRWLDVVRFAETEGFEYDRHIPGAWRYRDYVIAALNADKPFDRFVIEQIAGDEVAPEDPEAQAATILHRLGPVRRNAGNPEIALSRNEVLTERTDVIGSAFLGLTLGCARCHNHKLEPISQKDYYRLQAYFAATEEATFSLASEAERRAWEARSKPIVDRIAALRQQAKTANGDERARINHEIEELEGLLPSEPPSIPGIRNDFEHRTEIHVLRRGDWNSKLEAVGPRPPAVLVPDDLPEAPGNDSQPRTRLARWLTSPDNPLTARVIVNRLWQGHFGTGLVKTANDLGTKGDPPSHPELIDWLAATLRENGWRLKPLHRLIVLSQTYRQASRLDLPSDDPDNRLLSSFPRRRLSAEEIRDAMLVVSGRLNPRMGGPGVMVPVDPELVKLLYKPSQWKIAADRSEYDRRSIYLIAKRNLRLPFLETFDAPTLTTSCPRRESSTHAPQALELLNGSLSNDLARSFADRLAREAGEEPAAVIDRAFRLAFGRAPDPRERTLALDFLREQPASELALALFNLNEFLYLP